MLAALFCGIKAYSFDLWAIFRYNVQAQFHGAVH